TVAQRLRLIIGVMHEPPVEPLAQAVSLNAELIMRNAPLQRIAQEREVARRKTGRLQVAIGDHAVAGDALQLRIEPHGPANSAGRGSTRWQCWPGNDWRRMPQIVWPAVFMMCT